MTIAPDVFQDENQDVPDIDDEASIALINQHEVLRECLDADALTIRKAARSPLHGRGDYFVYILTEGETLDDLGCKGHPNYQSKYHVSRDGLAVDVVKSVTREITLPDMSFDYDDSGSCTLRGRTFHWHRIKAHVWSRGS